MNDQAAWYLAQLVAGLSPEGIDPQKFTGPYAEAYAAYSGGNGKGPKVLQAYLAQPGREIIRQAVFAFRPGSPAPSPDRYDYRLTDLGNAERLSDQHASQLRFVREWDWMHYFKGRWQRNPAAAVRCAKLTVRRIYGEAEQIEDDRKRKEIGAWAMRSESQSKIAAMLKLAESESAIMAEPGDFDSDPLLLNCKNGVVDLRTGKLRPHNASDLLSRMAPVDYDPKAVCPQWLRFLDVIFEGNKDVIAFVQRSFGYSLTGDTGEQVMFFCYGSGRNGKSTLLELMRYLIGDYSQQADASTFLVKQSDGVRNDIARMAGVRFVSSIEVGEGRRLNETLVKQVTGQDTISARFLHHEYFEFVPQFKLWMAANHKPIIRGTDEAIWRRIRLIPFDVTIARKDIDRKLKNKLQDEAPGILAWAIEGCRQWQSMGLKEPSAVIAATNEYRAEMDVLAAFIEACCVVNDEARATAGELYRTYKQWAETNGETVESQRAFGMRMNERSFERNRSNGTFIYKGLGLLSHQKE